MAEDFTPGSMDISVQEKTFAGFLTVVTRMMIGIFIFLILLAVFNG